MALPAGERYAARVRVDGGLERTPQHPILPVMSPVVEDVGEGAASLSGCPDLRGVVAVGEDLAEATAATMGAVDGARCVDGEALHAPGEHVPVGGLDEQVEVVVLDGDVHDPEVAVPQIASEHPADGAVHDALAQPPDALLSPQDDMDGVSAGELRASPVPRVPPPEGRLLAPRTLALAAVRRLDDLAHLD